MPLALFKTVREVSSEDSVHCAANLLKQDLGKKWKTKTVGEKSAYVILELEEPAQINGIDIGNEHSAFAEVLVGNTGYKEEDFTEILITCSFMTPFESKNSSIPNRVRCFNQEALVAAAASNKWRLVKVVCTQPFNKFVQYGLSFIKLHVVEKEFKEKPLVPDKFLLKKTSTECSESTGKTCPKLSQFGISKFSLREDSPDSESESTSALFSRWKTSRSGIDNAPTTAAAIREASSPAGLRRSSDNSTLKRAVLKASTTGGIRTSEESDDGKKVLDRNRDNLLFGDDLAENESPAKKLRLEKQIEVDKERLRIESEKQKQQKENAKRKNIAKPHQEKKTSNTIGTNTNKQGDPEKNELQSTNESANKQHHSPSHKPSKRVNSVTSPKKYRPFNKLLQGVVLVISGIQNPDRSELRKKALALGAKYSADWGKDCTHLICAFKNTPKYNQVKGQGKIVTRSWIEKCYSLKKYLPWRRYALDNTEVAKPESDEEISDETLKSQDSDCEETEKVENAKAYNDDKQSIVELYDLNDANDDIWRQKLDITMITSGSDTDDDIERIRKKNNSHKDSSVEIKSQKGDDIYEASTDEEDYLKKKIKSNIKSGTFFKNYNFFISDNVNVVDRIKLEKFIEKYAGHLTSDLSEAHYAIADTMLESNQTSSFTGETVKPLWIFECNNLESKISTSRYLIESKI